MMTREPTVDELLDELRRRVARLLRDAARPRSVGRVRELAEQAFDAGVAAGRAQQLVHETQRMATILDEATARMPDSLPEGSDANEPNVKYWRDGRQHLWALIDQARGHIDAEQRAEQGRAAKRRAWVDQLSSDVLAPVPPLRVRVGQWLINGSEFLTGIGKLRYGLPLSPFMGVRR